MSAPKPEPWRMAEHAHRGWMVVPLAVIAFVAVGTVFFLIFWLLRSAW